VAVPKDRFDLFHLDANVAVANGARLTLKGDPKAPTLVTDEVPGWEFARREWQIQETSYVHRLQRRDRSLYEIVVTRAPDTDKSGRPSTDDVNSTGALPTPELNVCVDHSETKAICRYPRTGYQNRAATFYGLVFVQGRYDLALPRAK